MSSKPAYKSKLMSAINASAEAFFEVGAMDKATLRTFDEQCLVRPPDFAPEEIKALRESQRVSQPIFARYLNTSRSTVKKWESGAKRPSGIALRLLTVVRKHGLDVLR